LHVIGTERHDSRRIDNQLRGRAGRQGDPGSSQFFLSMGDDLVRIFGGDRIRSVMERLKIPEDMPIQAGILSRALEQAQTKVEGHNFDARKHLLDYDDVLNKQRLAIYKKRQEMLETGTLPQILGMLDMLWMNHLEDMEALQESVRLRAVGQHDPLVEYRREGHLLYQQLLANFEQWLAENKEKIEAAMAHMASPEHAGHSHASASSAQVSATPKAVENLSAPVAEGDSTATIGPKEQGRNDPCACGSGKKYKKCHGI
jgi:preprotein translocase subunit SecA